MDNWGVTNKTQYTFGDYTLKNIAGYRRLEWDQRTDMDGSILPWIYAQQTQDVTMLSEELQLQGQSGRLNWIVGAYYFREYGTDGAVSANFPELFRLAPGAGTLTAAQQAFIDVGDADAKTWAAFLAGTFELTDRWKISAGLRYTDDEREISKSPMRPNINSCVWTNRTVPLSECRFSKYARAGNLRRRTRADLHSLRWPEHRRRLLAHQVARAR